jgi:stage II sporulation protein AA (anti-sigma F factor antagonist)
VSEPPGGVFEVETGHGVVSVRGEIDRVTVDQVVLALESAGDVVVLELARVTFIDSSGLQGILRTQQAARSRGGDVVLRQPSHVVDRVLEITGLRDAFVIER